MTSCWVENTDLLRNYPQYLKAQIVPGHEYSLVIFSSNKELPSDPYFKGYDIVNYTEHNGTFYVLLQLQSDQDHESLFTHLKVIAMTIPDNPGRSTVPTRQYIITVLLPDERRERISLILPVPN